MNHCYALLNEPAYAGSATRVDHRARPFATNAIVQRKVGRLAGTRDGRGEINDSITSGKRDPERGRIKDVRAPDFSTEMREGYGIFGPAYQRTDAMSPPDKARKEMAPIDVTCANDCDCQTHAASLIYVWLRLWNERGH